MAVKLNFNYLNSSDFIIQALLHICTGLWDVFPEEAPQRAPSLDGTTALVHLWKRETGSQSVKLAPCSWGTHASSHSHLQINLQTERTVRQTQPKPVSSAKWILFTETLHPLWFNMCESDIKQTHWAGQTVIVLSLMSLFLMFLQATPVTPAQA